MSFQEENDKLLETFLNMSFYRAWREGPDSKLGNYRTIEIMMNYQCNLACRYCYVSRYGKELYPAENWFNEELHTKNLDMVCDWIVENKFNPELEFFSGEALIQPLGHKLIRRLLDNLKGHVHGGYVRDKKTGEYVRDNITGEKRPRAAIIIPTNYTFMLHDDLTKSVKDLLAYSKEVGLRVVLSASFDGKYCESNRPFRASVTKQEDGPGRITRWEYKEDFVDPRDDAYYDKCFEFIAEQQMGFHPMIYSRNIENWFENFLWFQEMFKKYDISWTNLYLLEVRNVEWSKKQRDKFGEFIEFLIRWAWEQVDRSPERYLEFLYDRKGFNILASPWTTIGRGVGCSMQSGIYLRLADLEWVACHRMSYPHMTLARMKHDGEKITHIECVNPELLVGLQSTDMRNWPYCEACVLSPMCSGGCLGSQLEVTGDPFTPIPIVCALEYKKIYTMIKTYDELGILPYLRARTNKRKIPTIDWMVRELRK